MATEGLLRVKSLYPFQIKNIRHRYRYHFHSVQSIPSPAYIEPQPTAVDLAFECFEPSYQSPSPVASTSSFLPESRRTPLLILHGLYGSKLNWRSMGKRFAEQLGCRVFNLDLRNHGHSPAAPASSYIDYANDVQRFIIEKGLGQVNLMGHSMGGKVAMTLALVNSLRSRERESSVFDESSDDGNLNNCANPIKKLISVDIAPYPYPFLPNMKNYLDIMKTINRANIQNRKQADQILAEIEPGPVTRQFLLTNLIHVGGRYKIRLPLENFETLVGEENVVGSFPFNPPTRELDPNKRSRRPQFDKPTLFIKGAKSPYISRSAHVSYIEEFFPNHELVELDTGHWIQVEKPSRFSEIVTEFIQR